MDYECIWHFGRFSFCASDYSLKAGDSVQTLPPKQAALLLFFLENPSRVLSRNEILAHLWPSIHVGRTTLGVHIAGLRRALGDTANSSEFIATVSFLGFRFIREVQCTKTPVRTSADFHRNGISVAACTAPVDQPIGAPDSADLFKKRSSIHDTNRLDQAYRLYALGRRSWRHRTHRDIRHAIEYYKEAVNLASSFPLPYVGMADAYNYLSMHPDSSGTSYQNLRKAKECSYQAIRLNPNSAPAWAALGHAQFAWDWEVNAAEDSYQMAISLDPGYAPAHQWYSWLLLALGRRVESEREIRYAYHLGESEPSSKVAYGLHLHFLGQHDLALKEFRATLDTTPEFLPAYREIGRVYEAQGNYPEAIEVYRQARTRARRDAEMDAVFAHALTRVGEKKQATQILSDLLQNQAKRTPPLYEMAITLIGLGCLEDAVKMLEVLRQQHGIWPIWLLFDSRLECLRTELAFQRLVGRFVGAR
jgi:DNA-binding winged helix-turn-helix (wHTH) protein/tetratricopeptide (TPR) repeat protein